jgi:DNA replication and repair protein RecF
VPVSNITLNNFRCFKRLELNLSPRVNFFYGKNGSGKTSILEAIYMCSSGKSFKSSNIAALVKQNATGFKINSYDNLTGHVLDLKKELNKSIEILVNNKKTPISELIRQRPATAIHNQTFSFADASPDFRRKLMDRAIFVSDKEFSQIWFSYYRCLKQRNALLKQNSNQTKAWDERLINFGVKLTTIREDFHLNTLKELSYLVKKINKKEQVGYLNNIEISFRKGWNEESNLEDIVNNNKTIDLLRRTTTKGPHKADIKFLINNMDAKQILSRGEQKLFSILWCCAQHRVLKNTHKLEPVLIIDDTKSELDKTLMNVFINMLEHIENQVIFSCIDDEFSSKINTKFEDFKKFHVEQLHQ